MDMDNLKKINDIYGHKAGDRALKLLGTLLSEYTHQAVVCRLGGDEFLMFMPDCSKEELSEIVQGILGPVSYTHLDVYKRQALF